MTRLATKIARDTRTLAPVAMSLVLFVVGIIRSETAWIAMAGGVLGLPSFVSIAGHTAEPEPKEVPDAA